MAGLPVSELTVEVAKRFLGTPYVAGTLESEKEELRVFLDKTDCILFVELCTCFALTVKGVEVVQGGDGGRGSARPSPSVRPRAPSYELLCDNIRNMRYRGGIVDGYASRIHYTSEWILQNEANGIMTEFTSGLGSPYSLKFSFMTSHRSLYPRLVEDASLVRKIRAVEEKLDACGPYYKISQARLRQPSVLSRIHDGDIIAFIDTHEGLDVSHVALAYSVDGVMHFIHASSRAGAVVIEGKTLADYAVNGIRVIRLNEPVF